MEIAPGKELGRLEILAIVHAGGTGELFQAHDNKSKQDVSVYVLPPEDGKPLRFEREHYAAAQLKHPNILGIRGLRSKLGISYVITDKIEGELLSTLLENGPLAPARVIGIAAQIADALAAAHQAGVLHRGLRPEHILVDEDGGVKVFGFAFTRHPRPERETTAYMSPEQVRGEPLDPRSDIFSLGAVLYQMATGLRAFNAPTGRERKQAILGAVPEQPPSTVPAGLVNVIGRCLERDLVGRFQSAGELRAALDQLAEVAAPVALPEPAPVKQPLVPKLPKFQLPRATWLAPALEMWRQRQQTWIPLAFAALALLLIGDFIIRARTGRPEAARFQRLTFRQGPVMRARLTPDGKAVIYTAHFDGSPQATYLTTPGNADARDLHLPERSTIVAVSSKQDLAIRLANGVLIKQPLAGNGTMRQEADNVFDADFAPDGEHMAVAHWMPASRNSRVEYPIGKVLYETDQGLDLVRISPDGKRVAFTAYDRQDRRLWVVSRSGTPKLLTTLGQGEATRTLCWSPDSSEIWYSSVLPQDRGLILAVDLSGHKRRVNWFPESNLDDVAPGGQAIVEVFRAWSGILFRGADDVTDRDLSWLGEAVNVRLSSESQRIFFTEYGGADRANYTAFMRSIEGGPATRLGDGNIIAGSPDGRWLTLARGPLNSPKYILVSTADASERPLDFPGLLDRTGAVVGWTKDGKQLVWGRYPTKGPQYFLWSPATQSLQPASPEGIPFGVASDDATRVAFQSLSRAWSVFDVGGTEPQPARGLTPADRVLRWADSTSVYTATPDPDAAKFTLSRVNLTTGERTMLRDIQSPTQADRISAQSIGPDGRSLVYSYYRSESDLYLAQGLK